MLKWCLKQGEKGENHTGIREIAPDREEARKHIDKALHNLRAFDHNQDLFPDWAVSAAFYAMYHALLAILFSLGYESRNQECTLNAVEHFIDSGTLELDKRHVRMVRQIGTMIPEDAKSLREQFQYGTKVRVNSALLANLRKNAIGCVEAVEVCLQST